MNFIVFVNYSPYFRGIYFCVLLTYIFASVMIILWYTYTFEHVMNIY